MIENDVMTVSDTTISKPVDGEGNERRRQERLAALGTWIQNRRKTTGIASQQEAGEKVGVSTDVWGLWERGRALPKGDQIPRVADVLQVAPDDFRERIEFALSGDIPAHISRQNRPTLDAFYSEPLATKRDIEALDAKLLRLLEILGTR